MRSSSNERVSSDPTRLPVEPTCPFCEGAETEIMNAFGSHVSVSTYWCRRCHSPFEMFKWRGGEPSARTGGAGHDPADDRSTRS